MLPWRTRTSPHMEDFLVISEKVRDRCPRRRRRRLRLWADILGVGVGSPVPFCRSASFFPLVTLSVNTGASWSPPGGLAVSSSSSSLPRDADEDEDNNGEKEGTSSRARRDAPRPRAPRRPLHDVYLRVVTFVVGGVTASLPSKHHNNSHKTNERACRRRL